MQLNTSPYRDQHFIVLDIIYLFIYLFIYLRLLCNNDYIGEKCIQDTMQGGFPLNYTNYMEFCLS